MSVAPEIVAAAEKMRDVASRLKADAERLLTTLVEAKQCGVDTRRLDFEMIKVRFMAQIPEALEKKASALLPKDEGQ